MSRGWRNNLTIVMAGSAIAGVAALIWFWPSELGSQPSRKTPFGASPAAARYSQETPVFARIVVSEKSVVYVQIQGTELRAAMSVEGLQAIMPVKMHMNFSDAITFPEFTLPVPADQLPAHVTAIKANLCLQLIMSDVTSKRDATSRPLKKAA